MRKGGGNRRKRKASARGVLKSFKIRLEISLSFLKEKIRKNRGHRRGEMQNLTGRMYEYITKVRRSRLSVERNLTNDDDTTEG